MLPRSPIRRPDSGFKCLLITWTFFACIASATGGQYVAATLDCLGPAVLAQAAAALLHSITSGLKQVKKDGFDPEQTQQQQQQHAGRRAWVLALGLLHLMSTILTLASFGLSSVSETYIVRTLEPIFSCVLLYILHGQKRSRKEVLLLALVAGATAAVVLAGPQPDKELTPSSHERLSPTRLPGRWIPLALALVATWAVSCRSVASKTVAAVTRVPEYDTFLEGAAPGFVAAVVLVGVLWGLFGMQPLAGLAASWSPAAPASLLACGLSQCVYNAASFKVLQQCTPVMHGVLNVLKRVFIIVGSAVLLGNPLTALQLLGVVVAHAAAAVYVQQQSGAAPALAPRSSTSSRVSSAADGSFECLDGKTGDKDKPRRSWFGSAAPSVTPAGHALIRLVHTVAGTLLVSALFLAYVVAALQSSSAQQHGQHQQHVAQPQAVEQFLFRDFQRIQCLTALHEASKASLAPFLAKRTAGRVALFDVALHKNLGDAVLWAAAARLVPSFHESVQYVCAQSQFPGGQTRIGAEARKAFPKCDIKGMLEAIGQDGVVLLAPGGNWGDLWWAVHSQRLQYLKDLAAQARISGAALQVVQLPQSLSFSSPHISVVDQQTINSLPASMLTLFTRQQDSLAYAQAHYPNTTVLPGPDLAFSLGPLMPGEAQFDVLFLMRDDKEAAGSEQAVGKLKPPQRQQGASVHTEGSSGSEPAHSSRGPAGSSSSSSDGPTAADVAAGALEQLQQLGLTYSIREWGFQHANVTKEVSKVALVQVAESRLQGAVDVISLGKVVVTNRLHAAIMANLVGRPLIWIDTAQRKISGVRSLAFSYSSACSEASMHSVQASSFAEGAAIAAAWLQSPAFIWSTQQLQLPQLRR